MRQKHKELVLLLLSITSSGEQVRWSNRGRSPLLLRSVLPPPHLRRLIPHVPRWTRDSTRYLPRSHARVRRKMSALDTHTHRPVLYRDA